MKKLLSTILAAVFAVVGLTNVAIPAYATGEQNPAYGYLDGITPDEMKDQTDKGLMGIVSQIINAVIGIVGVIAVIMMIVGGISFITSQGDASKVTKARNTILYGVVGLVVALLAFAIVNFVLGEVFKASVWL